MQNKKPYVPLEIWLDLPSTLSVLSESTSVADNDGSWDLEWGDDAL